MPLRSLTTLLSPQRAAPSALLAVMLTLPLLASAAPAAVYKTVGTNGRVTYSDVPPMNGGAASGAGDAGKAGTPGANTAGLPTALRLVAAKYPVVLYTATGCGPCAQARAFLQQRGVPYAERTVNTNADIAELTRRSGDTTVPFATLGQQPLKGFSANDWGQYLDAAGYPATSQLPRGYGFAAATPLVPVKKPAPGAVPEAPAEDTEQAAAPASPAPAPAANPAGIRF